MSPHLMQMLTRRIGSVYIVDFRGEVAGPWALRARESLSKLFREGRIHNVLIDLRDLETVDSLGVKAIVDHLGGQAKCGVVVGRPSVMEMFECVPVPHHLRLFRNEAEVLRYFGEEFVQGREGEPFEARKHPRIKTALPLEFSWRDEEGRKLEFQAIVTDLSEGGLFAEYLDLKHAERVGRQMDPYDFKMLDLRIKLPDTGWIGAKGKVVRTTWDEQVGLGIEFYQISDEDRRKIREFLR